MQGSSAAYCCWESCRRYMWPFPPSPLFPFFPSTGVRGKEAEMKPKLAHIHCLSCQRAQPSHSQSLVTRAETLEVCVQLVSEVGHLPHCHCPALTPRCHNQLLLTLDAQLAWQPLLPMGKHLEVV